MSPSVVPPPPQSPLSAHIQYPPRVWWLPASQEGMRAIFSDARWDSGGTKAGAAAVEVKESSTSDQSVHFSLGLGARRVWEVRKV